MTSYPSSSISQYKKSFHVLWTFCGGNFLPLFNRVSGLGLIGVLSNFIPALLAALFDFFMLQLIQAATTLSHLVLPPRDFGKT